ncbi:APC family permease [Streptomyces shenzhenensis]|uniref:APC family permease n=1 Tax=Streptomyces shenzhenensis TaxID=943815 RepID=UPI0015F04DDF|nr:APC family permease [Streptomyces shenzhenensis]
MKTNSPEIHCPSEQPSTETAASTSFTLKGNMGTFGLLFTVLAFTAPLGVVFGFISVNISFGIAVPIAFVGVLLLMALFAVGFTNMSRKIPRPGAFYTYIGEGLGRPLGLGGSFLALVTYGFNIIAAIVFAGIAVKNLVVSFVDTSALPWWAGALVVLGTVWALSYFNVELSAKVLSTVLVVEVLAVLIFDAVVIGNGGPEGQSFAPWNPANLITPSLGILLLFSVGVFNGFEATAIYRDEVRDPGRTIPRATYLTIIFLGVFYAISSYALILSAGVSHAVADAAANPVEMMPHALLTYFGAFANQVIAILLVTSTLASALSLQNILSRYTHSLAVDGVLPRRLADVHRRHGSPHVAAVTVGAVLLAALIGLIASGISANDLYGGASGVAFYGMLLLLFLTCVAVIVYFRRNRAGASPWKTFVAPAVAALGIGFALLKASLNMELLIVAPGAVVTVLLLVGYAALAAGVVIALVLKRKGSPVYERIGRRAA